MRRFPIFFLVMTLSWFAPDRSHGQTLSVGTGSGLVGSTLFLPVTLGNSGARVVALQFDVLCNPSQVKVAADPSKGGALAGVDVLWGTTHDEDFGRVIVWTPDLSPLPSGEIAVLTFEIVGGSGIVPLTLSNVTAGDRNGDPLYPLLTHGSISIIVLEADIEVSPNQLHFGGVAVGTSSSPQTVSVTNLGLATLNIGTIDLGGLNPSQFTLSENTCTEASLSFNQQCTFQVIFHPQSSGSKSAQVVIVSDDPDENPYSLPLTGNGLETDIAVTPSILDFGSVAVGSFSERSVTVRNDGTADLVLGTVGNPSTPYSKTSDHCSGEVLNPTESCSITILFSPSAGGTFNSSFTIPSNDPDEPSVEVSLSGIGLAPDITVLPPSVDFGKVLIGSGKDQTITVRNDGMADLVLDTIGSPPSPFARTGGTCNDGLVLPHDAMCTISLRFTPSNQGSSPPSSFTVISNDSDEPTVTIPLSGKGVLCLLNPDEGTIGSNVVVTGTGSGTGFGGKKGKVLLGGTALKVLEWTGDSIRCLLSKAMSPGPYDVTIVPKEPKGTAPVVEEEAFRVRLPGIDLIYPSSGAFGETITIEGDFFGTKKGKVSLQREAGGVTAVKNCKVASWTMTRILFVVPKGLSSGPYDLYVTNQVGSGKATFSVK